MGRLRPVALFLVVIAAGLGTSVPSSAQIGDSAPAASLTVWSAAPASAFTESVGMNVHTLSTYRRYARNVRYVIELLRAAHIRHVRGYDLQFGPTDSAAVAFVNALASAGIRSSAGMTSNFNARTPEGPSFIADAIGLLQPGAIEALEGPNELDICCRDPQWAADDIASMATLVSAARARANLASLEIIGPSLAFADHARLGDLSASERAVNVHTYYAGFMPETSGWGASGFGGYRYGDLRYSLANARRECERCAAIATEAGYCTALATRNCVPEDVEAAWVTRLLLNHWMAGVKRTYLYELMAQDRSTPDGSLGLIGPDLTPKPAFRALAGMMQILLDSPHAGRCGFPVTIRGAVAGLRALELCKATGEVDLVLWLARQGYDTNALRATPVAPVRVSLEAELRLSPATLWTYGASGIWSAVDSADASSLRVTDFPEIVALGGSGSANALAALPKPPNTDPAERR